MMALTPIVSDLLPRGKHGFFTRQGGASDGIYAGLNCGRGSRDTADNVAKNRQAVAEMFYLDNAGLLSVHQIHSPDVVHVDAPFTGEPPQCDAMVTSTAGLGLGVLSADCAPVLFADSDAGVVGAAHSGWKGAVGGVLDATITAMETLGATRSDIVAVVGPCISQKAYEVGPDFLDTFMLEDPSNSQYFAQGRDDRYMFDLPRFVLDRLRRAGVKSAEWTGHCTLSDPAKFYSYRRSCLEGEPDYGRLISVICC